MPELWFSVNKNNISTFLIERDIKVIFDRFWKQIMTLDSSTKKVGRVLLIRAYIYFLQTIKHHIILKFTVVSLKLNLQRFLSYLNKIASSAIIIYLLRSKTWLRPPFWIKVLHILLRAPFFVVLWLLKLSVTQYGYIFIVFDLNTATHISW